MPTAQVLLLLVALPCGIADWWAKARAGHPAARRVEAVAKPLATVLVIGVAATGDGAAVPRLLGVAALALCLVGDVLLLPALDQFVGGLAAFLVGHLVFVGALVAIGLEHPVLGTVAAVVAAVLAVTIGRRIVAGARATDPTLGAPVSAYLLVILTMLVTGWATGHPLVVLGATLFVVSDSLLGWDRFVGSRRELQVAVMVTYHAAIGCLAVGTSLVS